MLPKDGKRPHSTLCFVVGLICIVFMKRDNGAPYEMLEGYVSYSEPRLYSDIVLENQVASKGGLGMAIEGVVVMLAASISSAVGGIDISPIASVAVPTRSALTVPVVEAGDLKIPCGSQCQVVAEHLGDSYLKYLREAAPREYIVRVKNELDVYAKRDNQVLAWYGSGSIVPYLWFSGGRRETVLLEKIEFSGLSLDVCGNNDKLWCLHSQLGEISTTEGEGSCTLVKSRGLSDAWLRRCSVDIAPLESVVGRLKLEHRAQWAGWMSVLVALGVFANLALHMAALRSTRTTMDVRPSAAVLFSPLRRLPAYWAGMESTLNGQLILIAVLMYHGAACPTTIAAAMCGVCAAVVETSILLSGDSLRLYELRLGKHAIYATKIKIASVLLSTAVIAMASPEFTTNVSRLDTLNGKPNYDLFRRGVEEEWDFGLSQRVQPSDYARSRRCYDMSTATIRTTIAALHYEQLWNDTPRGAKGNPESAEVAWGGLLQSEFEAKELPVTPIDMCTMGSPSIEVRDEDSENEMMLKAVDVSATTIKKHINEVSRTAASKAHLINKLSTGGGITMEGSLLGTTLTSMIFFYVVITVALAIMTAGIILPFPTNDKQGKLLDGWTSKGPRHMRVVLKKDEVNLLTGWAVDVVSKDLIVERSLGDSLANSNGDQNKESQNSIDDSADVTHVTST
ncbi:MAG: hypothetical protein SGBAC_005423 [Bacillariaceae sp.]